MLAETGARFYLEFTQAIQIGPDGCAVRYCEQMDPIFIGDKADKVLQVSPEIEEQACQGIGM
ncbi:hypothetical protein C7I87_08505 [Mesorhizobium sp. SARCC-RB16n]|nr:hypothetical protein C7I87_08505 [Mesorhizobium sp. SARCC-RB16n]